MKKIKYFILVLLVGLFLASCSGNSSSNPSFESMSNTAKTSLKDVKTVESTSILTEGSSEVYKLVRTITVTTTTDTTVSGNIQNVVSQYGSGFQYTTTTTTSSFNDSSLNTLFNYNLDESLFSEKEVNIGEGQNTLTGKVSKDNVASFLNNTEIPCSSDLVFSFIIAEDKIISLNCSYTTNNSRNATISVVYTY